MIALVVVVLLVFWAASAPGWGYSRDWGYRPFSGLGFLLACFLVWYFLFHGRI